VCKAFLRIHAQYYHQALAYRHARSLIAKSLDWSSDPLYLLRRVFYTLHASAAQRGVDVVSCMACVTAYRILAAEMKAKDCLAIRSTLHTQHQRRRWSGSSRNALKMRNTTLTFYFAACELLEI
jgi:hypothetical protein